jgi:hypothetical protein
LLIDASPELIQAETPMIKLAPKLNNKLLELVARDFRELAVGRNHAEAVVDGHPETD